MTWSAALLDFAVITIFARETLEGGIIIGEYRTVIMRTNWENSSITKNKALRAVTVSALLAALVAVVVCAAIAIPLAILSLDFKPDTAKVIEGVSKIVAAICLLQLSLKMPKVFGLYYSKAQFKKMKNNEPLDETMDSRGMSLRSIRFNVAWNIWREVAECGVFLLPSFLTGEGILAIPLSAVVGVLVGGAICVFIYYANHYFKNTKALTVFTVGLFLLLSTGLFTGGCANFENVYGSTPIVYQLKGDFWSIDRLPMTIFKPFGYSDTRTVLQVCCFWIWMAFSLLLHYVKYKRCMKPPSAFSDEAAISRAAVGENIMEEIKEDGIGAYSYTHEDTREPSDSESSGGSPRDVEGGNNEETETQGEYIQVSEA
mmetsp:Transcript_269/g.670  ORF Transcript_269/g.670 Transcript_269/m.670 type:complete len:372 (-) Transcript_269:1396-2511(-)|eukprot:CAMPEP_0172360906 /NCGR_PEP_ID=MMETSP1060-20121228/4830_1 /TAXON_ID=37318 /ORGANISM="Pseudo-nitzschia pungens, Strain cf. cingulata" /LENGTH=371 /DNA_ID=CAMNT_0013083013 /DNA_START=327 /DNA_END=1442 /DNA_ORIENTATION=-